MTARDFGPHKNRRSTPRKIQHRPFLRQPSQEQKQKAIERNQKQREKRKQNKQIMKLFQMITAALANSSFFQSNNNCHEKSKTKKISSSWHDEIAEILTPPPSIFVSGHTILDSSIPFIHIDVAVAVVVVVPSSFDLVVSTIVLVVVSSCKDLRKVIQQQFVPSANQALQEFQQLKTKTHELLAAAAATQVKKTWCEIRTAAAQKLRSWLFDVTLSMVHASMTKMPRCVWDWMNAVATMVWRCRHTMFQALSLINQLCSTMVGRPLLFLSQAFPTTRMLTALFNHDDGPVKNLFVAASCSELGSFVLLMLKMTWNLVLSNNCFRRVLKILAYLALRQILDVIACALRKALPRVEALQLLPIVLAFLLR
jgi:hypothetical protein